MGHSVGLHRGQHAAALERSMRLCRGAAWGSGSALRGAAQGVAQNCARGAAWCCSGVLHKAVLGRRMQLGRRAVWDSVGAQHAAAQGAAWGCIEARCGTAQGRCMQLNMEAVMAHVWQRKGRRVACGDNGTQSGTVQQCGMLLLWRVACRCPGAKLAAALGRSVGLCRWAAWGSAGFHAELRKGRSMVPRRGAASSCTGAWHAAGLRRSMGLHRGTACGCARAATWGCVGGAVWAQCAPGRCSRPRKGCGIGAVVGVQRLTELGQIVRLG